MEVNDLRNKLYEAVHDDLFISKNKDIDIENEIINYLVNSKNYFDDLRIIISNRNNENYFCYDKYISNILKESSLDIKLEILNNQNFYSDIIRNNDTYLVIFNSLKDDEKYSYLESKKRFSDLDYFFINNFINSDFNNYFNIIKNYSIREKMDINSININYDNSLLDIDLSDYEICKYLGKEIYTTLLLKKYNTFNEFIDLYNKENNIFNLILGNSLVFSSDSNEDIYEFILKKPNFLGKFNNKYMDLFSIKEINNLKNKKDIDSDSFSNIIQRLFSFDKENANKYFNEDNLLNCSKHSIVVNPFDYLSDNERKIIFNNYSLFNKFIDTIMIEVMNNYFVEDDIVNMLRDDNFINDISSFAIELLLNKLSFKSSFNMLQKKNILDKINHLNININERDFAFVKGFLDSPNLISKTDHNMLFNMLNSLNEKDFYYYITLPYILENLSNNEIINLCDVKNINIHDIINSIGIMEKINTNDLINLIDLYFIKNLDLSIFYDNKLCELVFNLTKEQVDSINFNEVNYLFETIRTKGFLSQQDNDVSVLKYKSILCAYLVFGLESTLKLVNNGDKSITLDDIKLLEKDIVKERLLLYREDNSGLFQNMMKEVLEELEEVGIDSDIDVFEKNIRNNTYLDNIIYLMLDNNYDSYNNILKRFYSFNKYSSYGEYDSKKELYEYIKSFTNTLLSNKEKEFYKDFDKIILKNFKVKENVIYSERKRIARDYLKKLKFKLFVRSLTDTNYDNYINYYIDGFDIKNIKNLYIKCIGKTQEFDNILEHILYPISNNRFDRYNCLDKLGISKPDNYDNYYKNLNNIKLVDKINSELDQYKYLFTQEEFLDIMNYICYGNKINFRIKTKVKNAFKSLRNIANQIDGEFYVDKSIMLFVYKDNSDIYNVDEIINYSNYLKIIDDIIRKTESFINKYMDNVKIISCYSNDYFNHINTDNSIFPISNRYYEPKRRVFSLKDIVNIFNGYNLTYYTKISNSLYDFLFNKKNIIMYCDGYYDGIVDNLGLIISKWNTINLYAKDMDMDEELSLIQVERLLSLINYNHDIFGQSLNRDIIKNIYNAPYYEVFDLNKRMEMLSNLYKDSYKKIYLSIPYIEVNDDCYSIRIIDKYNQDIFRTIDSSPYVVGKLGNDFLHYSILNDNGFKIGVYKKDKLIANALGIRNGNCVFINSLEGEYNKNYTSLFKKLALQLIEETKDDVQNIEFVMMVNNDLIDDSNSIIIDSTICDIVNYPIYNEGRCFEEFKNNSNLLNIDNNMYTNYGDNITILLASSNVVDKKNFKYYDPDSKYLRKRNKALKLSTNIGDDYLSLIDNIILLCKEADDSINTDISLSIVDTIYLGDDYVIFITEKKNVIKYVLNYDDRVNDEINFILSSIE